MSKKLGFGFMRLPLTDDKDQSSIDFEHVNKMVDAFIEEGFTYFDTAYMYHNFKSEGVLKKSLVDRYPREAYTIADKMPTFFLKKEEDLERIFNEQLENVGVEYFDYYLLHCLDTNNYETAQKFNAFDFILKKKAEGKIKQIGFSFHDKAQLLDEILTAHPEVDFVQIQLNYIDWETENIQSRKCYEVCTKHNKPVIVMEPVKGGTLADIPEKPEKLFKDYAPNMSVASWAIRYAASFDNVIMVLSGMSTLQQLEDNTLYMKDFKALNKEEYDIVNKAVTIINEGIEVPCTSCEYCVEGCPKKIAIPTYFTLYNNEKKGLNKGGVKPIDYYKNYSKEFGKASDCIECGKCEKSCPQHIEIVDSLKKVACTFEK